MKTLSFEIKYDKPNWRDELSANEILMAVKSSCENISELTVRELPAQPELKQMGCFCDIEPCQKPEECVFDNGDICDCVYAQKLQKENKGKEDCEYWRTIPTKPEQGREQVNVRFLISAIDRIHAALCSGQSGTWQMRAEQAVKAAEKVKQPIPGKVDEKKPCRRGCLAPACDHFVFRADSFDCLNCGHHKSCHAQGEG